MQRIYSLFSLSFHLDSESVTVVTMRMSSNLRCKGTYQGDIYLTSHVRRYRLISNDTLKKLLHPHQIINSPHSRRTPNTPFAAPTRPVDIPERIRPTQSHAHCNVTSPWESASVASDQFSQHATPRSGALHDPIKRPPGPSEPSGSIATVR